MLNTLQKEGGRSLNIALLSAGSKLAFVGLFLVDSFRPSAVLSDLMALCFAAMAALSFARARRGMLIVSAILFAAGSLVLVRTGAGYGQWRTAILENAGIIVLVLSTPMLSACLRFRPFEDDLRAFAARRIRSPLSFYNLLLGIGFPVGMLLNMAALPLLFHVFDRLRREYPERTFYNAFTRSYFISVMWSPNYVSMAVVINYLGIQWLDLAGWGLAFCVLAMLLSIGMEWARLRLSGEARAFSAPKKGPAGARIRRKGLYWLAAVIVYVMAGILLLGWATGKGVMVVVPIVSFGGPAILALLLRGWGMLGERFARYVDTTLPGINNDVFLFSSAGFLAAAFKHIDMGTAIAGGLAAMGVDSDLPLIALLIAFIGLPPLVGVHPIITISAVASVYAAGGLAISQLQLALAMLTGYHMYAAVSPFSSGVLVLSNLSGKSAVDLGLRINGLYTLVTAALFACLIALL